jgi:hypothetical protein
MTPARTREKQGNKKLIDGLRRYYFKDKNITKKRWKAFFDDDDNFVRGASKKFRDLDY